MPTSKTVAMFVATLLALSACGDDGGGDDTTREPTATTGASTTSVDEIADEDLERAQSALLQLTDMPAGWSESVGDDDDTGSITADENFAACIGVPVEELNPPDELSFDSTFADGDSMEVASSTSVWPTPDDALTRMESRTGDDALACIPEALEAMLKERTDADDDVTVNGVDVGRINLDLPGNAVAIRITVSMESQGFEIDLFLDSVVGTVDNIGWSVSTQDVFTPPDPATTAEYAALVHGHLVGDVPRDDQDPAGDDATSEPVGTRGNPVPLGQPASLDSWEVTLESFELDATDTLLAADEFNDPPPDDMQYSLLRVSATYVGDGDGSPAIDLTFEVVGDDQRRYDESDCAVELSVLPEALYSEPDVFTGGVVEGNVCVVTPVALGEPIVNVSETMAFDGEPIWFSVT